MLFEQPASLNHLIPESGPSWELRWKYIGNFLPVFLFISFVPLETVSVALWIKNEWELWRVLLILLGLICLFLVLVSLYELMMRRSARSHRLLNVLENGVGFGVSDRPSISWARIEAFWFEDISGKADVMRLTMEYFGSRKARFPRRTSLVLEKRTQVQAMVSELKLCRQKGGYCFRIELNQAPPAERRHSVVAMTLGLAGYLLLMHGLPMLAFSLQGPTARADISDSQSALSPQQDKRIHLFVAAHFASKAEIRRYFLELGTILTAAGISLMFGLRVIQKPKDQSSSPAFTAHSG